MGAGAMAEQETTDFALGRLAAEQQFALWHDLVRPLFRVSLEDAEAAGSFRADVQAAPIADALLTTCTARAQTFERDHGDVRSSGWDHVVIQHYVAGGFEGACGDRTVAVTAGDVNVLDLNRTLRTRATDFSNLTLILPRDRLAIAGTHDLHGRALRGGDAIAAVIGSHLRSLSAHAGALTPREAGSALDALCLLLAGSDLREADPLVRAAASASAHERICAHIDRHLDDPDLTPAGIAAACRVSRATLYRLFGFEGGVMAYIAGRRLDRAFTALCRPEAEHTSIAEVAYRSGFTSEAHFSRSFRSRFAMAPREARRRAREGLAPARVVAGLGPNDWIGTMRRLRETF
ncbi:helix-turn-helix domain-containing protein [Methylobacterium aquaticum]|uniref:AraC-type DNA-binding domain-containing proteins n=3 Tax=Methylobacterium TaxID=407 RepID=A0A0C6FG46_9HYPH|nr:helix-turn-helix domain-containing protein [Methylobacterium aquaticum]BAQ47528.1 AraC-type DNA-binding domain-containing proteins [Methylobacterium aquaticum]